MRYIVRTVTIKRDEPFEMLNMVCVLHSEKQGNRNTYVITYLATD